jgi:hypothetical protein
MRSFIGRYESLFIQRSTQHLHALQYHFYHVLVTVITCTGFNVGVQNKYIHNKNLNDVGYGIKA